MGDFAFASAPVALPPGAWAGPERRMLRFRGRDVLGVTAGAFRPYLFPVYTPAGYAVTTESPSDHPHHHSLWAGADHVHLHMPAAEERIEIYAYNLYVNDIFQGRAPGRIVETAIAGSEQSGAFRIVQSLEWRGPVEWGAPLGRSILRESRTTVVRRVDAGRMGPVHRLDVTSELTCAGHDVDVGPTRHAWFNARVTPGMSADSGGTVCAGLAGASVVPVDPVGALDIPGIRWVDCTGPVGGGHLAGIALAPGIGHGDCWWFVSDWGVITASPCRDAPVRLRRNASPVVISARYVVHDGAPDAEALGSVFAAD